MKLFYEIVNTSSHIIRTGHGKSTGIWGGTNTYVVDETVDVLDDTGGRLGPPQGSVDSKSEATYRLRVSRPPQDWDEFPVQAMLH